MLKTRDLENPVRTDVSEENVVSIIRVERTMLSVTEDGADSFLRNRQGPHGATSQKTSFFIEDKPPQVIL
jgi:hypothetical protein